MSIADAAAVRAVAAKFIGLWDAHMMERLVSCTPRRRLRQRDRAADESVQQIVTVHVAIHEKRMRQSTLVSENVTVRFVAPTAAVVHDTWSMTGDLGAPGWKIGDLRRGIIVHVLQKTEAGWRIVATQNTDTLDLPAT